MKKYTVIILLLNFLNNKRQQRSCQIDNKTLLYEKISKKLKKMFSKIVAASFAASAVQALEWEAPFARKRLGELSMKMPGLGELSAKAPTFARPDVMMRPNFAGPEAPAQFDRFDKPDQFKGLGKAAPFNAFGYANMDLPEVQHAPAKMMPDRQFGLQEGFGFGMKRNFEIPPTATKFESPLGMFQGDRVPFMKGARPTQPAARFNRFTISSLDDLSEPTEAPKMEKPEGLNFNRSDDSRASIWSYGDNISPRLYNSERKGFEYEPEPYMSFGYINDERYSDGYYNDDYCGDGYCGDAYDRGMFRGHGYNRGMIHGDGYDRGMFRGDGYDHGLFHEDDYDSVTFRDDDYDTVAFHGDDYDHGLFRGDDYDSVTFHGDDYDHGLFLEDDYDSVKFRGDDYDRVTFRGDDYDHGLFREDHYASGTFRGDDYDHGLFHGDDYDTAMFRGDDFDSVTFRDADYGVGTFRGDDYDSGLFRGDDYDSGTFADNGYYGRDPFVGAGSFRRNRRSCYKNGFNCNDW